MVLAAANFVPKTTIGYTEQNDTVKLWLRLFFSLIPAFFIFIGFTVLLWYPIDREKHDAVMAALHRRQAREEEEGKDDFDPSYMTSVDPDPVTGEIALPRHPHATVLPKENLLEIIDDLDHFSNGELTAIGDGEGWRANALTLSIVGNTAFFGTLLGIASWVVALGWDAMQKNSYDGKDSASVSPIGMVLGGFSFAIILFNLLRAGAASRIQSRPETMAYLVAHGVDYADPAASSSPASNAQVAPGPF